MYSLCNMKKNGTRLTYQTIHNAVAPVWPSGKVFTKSDAFYMKIKVRQLLPLYELCDEDYNYKIFATSCNEPSLLGGIDDITSMNNNEAHKMAKDAWKDIEEQEGDSENNIVSFFEYLKIIVAQARGFSYKLAWSRPDGEGNDNIQGVLWMTATM